MGAGVYRIPNLLIEAFCVYTQQHPVAVTRARPASPRWSSPASRIMDMIARELGLDPADLRRKNLLRDGDHLADRPPSRMHVRAGDNARGGAQGEPLGQSPSRGRGSDAAWP